jgi:hypothetical protein
VDLTQRGIGTNVEETASLQSHFLLLHLHLHCPRPFKARTHKNKTNSMEKKQGKEGNNKCVNGFSPVMRPRCEVHEKKTPQ